MYCPSGKGGVEEGRFRLHSPHDRLEFPLRYLIVNQEGKTLYIP